MKKQFVVIGGTSGIGSELVEILGEDPSQTVFIGSRNQRNISLKENVIWNCCDIIHESPEFPQVTGALDGLVYSVGTINLKPFKQLKESDFITDWKINCLGAIKTIYHYLPQLLLRENSSVVAFSTVAVAQGMNYHTSTASAKGALEALFRSLAAEYCPKVRFNLIAPSLTDTPLAASLLNSETKREAAAKRQPLQRVGKAKELGAAAAFLLGEESSWMTGQVLHIDGGLSTLKVFS